MPMDTVVQTVHQVVKQPPPIHGAKKVVPEIKTFFDKILIK